MYSDDSRRAQRTLMPRSGTLDALTLQGPEWGWMRLSCESHRKVALTVIPQLCLLYKGDQTQGHQALHLAWWASPSGTHTSQCCLRPHVLRPVI